MSCLLRLQVRDVQYGSVLRLLFQTPTFRVNILPDVAGPELYRAPVQPNANPSLLFNFLFSAGALKNVVALAVGFVAGLKQEEQVGLLAAAASHTAQHALKRLL